LEGDQAVKHKSDILVLGSGIAGLSFALKAAEAGKQVALLTKRALREANTAYAQGGIASVLDGSDSFLSHVKDTLVAGAGLCKPEVVQAVVEEGPARIADLLRWGVRFSRQGKGSKSSFDLGREGGHSARRILHAADLTGHEIERALAERATRHPKISVFEWHHGVDLLKRRGEVMGVFSLDVKSGRVKVFLAKATVLATGGGSKAYLYTTNPDVATGDGLAMAYRAGARVANMEFFQFHPTCLFHPQAKRFLISEAVRGEGGILKDRHGRAFMARFHPLKDLAPRDVVARAIDSVMKESGDECVHLDITHKPAAWIRKRFPNIHKTCLSFGIDMTRQRIPVVPAAHFMCGGVQTDLDGATSLKRLYAVGEVACTGLHGANRLASNSLLEGLVIASRAAARLLPSLKALPSWFKAPKWKTGHAVDSNEAVVVTQNWDEIRRLMWNYVGIVRTNKRLARAASRIGLLKEEIAQYYWDFLITADLLELRNIATVAELVIKSALARKESRGLHYNVDYPKSDPAQAKDTLLQRRQRA
jgi:L-aspartate oxidase